MPECSEAARDAFGRLVEFVVAGNLPVITAKLHRSTCPSRVRKGNIIEPLDGC